MRTNNLVPRSAKELKHRTVELQEMIDEMRSSDFVFTWEDVMSQAIDMYEDEKGKIPFDRCLRVSFRSLRTSVFDLRD